jgi:glycosyltransferase involved in cell wall biosynthesis
VAIGEICQDILEANDFRITVRIPNRVEACNHHDTQSREPDSVLFAGRLIEKGLRETAIGVEQAGMRLFLVGPPELYSAALQYCPAEKVEYLGNKPNQELLLLLHKFEIVSVCSQSFDNYPTIGLEAIVHGCKIVTSEVTGISRLLVKHGIDSTVHVDEIPVFRKIQAIPIELFQSHKLLQEIIDPAITVDSYLSLLDSNCTNE